MPQNGFQQGACPAIMQPCRVRVHCLGEPYAPQRRRAPFAPARVALVLAISQARTHIVQQQVSVWPNQLETMFGTLGVAARYVFRHMASYAIGLVKQRLASQDALIIHLASLRQSK